MKKIFLFLFILFTTNALAHDYTQDPDCQIAYLFNEGSGTTTADATSNVNTGTFASSGHPAWTSTVPSFLTSGAPSYSVTSDSTSYINTGNSSVVQNGNSMTILMWMYPTSLASAQPNRLLDVNTNIKVGIDNVSTDLVFSVDGSTNLVRDSNTSAFSLNAWTFVAFTWDGSTTASQVHIYTATVGSPTVTEVSYATTTNGVSLTSNTGNNAALLNRLSDSARPFLGNVAEVGIFNAVLATSDLQAIANYGLQGLTTVAIPYTYVRNVTIRNATIE